MKTIITTLAFTLATLTTTSQCTISMAPQMQNITCNLSAIQEVTIGVSVANPIHTIKAPSGGVVTLTANPAHYTPMSDGVYTYTLVDAVSGCSNTAQFTVSSATVFPTFSLSSQQSFKLGCSTKSVDIVSISNVTTTGAPSYEMIPPGSSSVLPTGPLSPQTSYNLNTVGIWTVVVRDGANGCQTRMPFSVYLDTVRPSILINPLFTNTLTCSTPQLVMTGNGNVNNYTWSYWGAGGNITSVNASTLLVQTNANVQPISLLNTYSVTVKSLSNACINHTTVSIYQNIAVPTLSIASTWTLDCISNLVVLSPTSPPSNYNYNWEMSGSNASTLIATAAGNYTLNFTNTNTGCYSQAFVTVLPCSTVGIEEYTMGRNTIITYYDLSGNVIDKRYNEVIVERVGNNKGHLIRFEQ